MTSLRIYRNSQACLKEKQIFGQVRQNVIFFIYNQFWIKVHHIVSQIKFPRLIGPVFKWCVPSAILRYFWLIWWLSCLTTQKTLSQQWPPKMPPDQVILTHGDCENWNIKMLNALNMMLTGTWCLRRDSELATHLPGGGAFGWRGCEICKQMYFNWKLVKMWAFSLNLM